MATLAHPYQPWRKTSALQATGSIPLNENYEYRPLYPLAWQTTIGWGDMLFGATMGFLTQLGSNAIRKVPLHKGTMTYIKFILAGTALGQGWHMIYQSENVRWLNHMMKLEVQVQEMKAKQEPLLASGKTLAQAYPLK